ncbi:MAG: tetratricopeptide repeat protein [Flavobacterium sp.]|uniref:tetratricopeptide repeat protein n=1 Tax=Flavobacterium sp. TaxID=239 RepID=UPI0022BBD4A2|nr:tetratricopeptide repeat protein [Flavobacterium sp.]MCZ8196974.1 tetratricopeptide repeat protein [Flavobacterium sp.]
MTLFKKITLIFLFTYSFIGQAQNMTEGFSNLEKGEFDKAEVFFTTILKDYPQNKTARLCYARAVGLNKQPEKALTLFTALKNEYQDDLEIKLNYAESLLWNKKFDDAKIYYTTLVADNPTNFVAHLGFANTLSNLKEFKDALSNVNKALDLSPGNGGALVSRKYIKLGYANEMVSAKKYTEAETFYNEILADFPNDKETLLNKANLYLITKNSVKGREAYNSLSTSDPILALNGLSLVEHIAGKESKALEISEKAMAKISETKDENLIKQTQERNVQAFIWNKKYKLAENKIAALNQLYANENWLLALSATLAIYKSDFKDSIKYYKNILANDSKSFDGNLGIANAYYASGEIDNSIKAVYQTLEIFKNQNDAMNFIKKLNEEHTPTLEEKLSYSFDNGNNTAITSRTLITFPLSTKWSVNTTYQLRKTENSITNVSANANDFLVGAAYKFHPKISFNIDGGITSASSTTSSYTSLLFNSYFKTKPMKLQDLEIGYKRDLQNFNTDLIDKQISANNFYLNNNFGTNFKLGWFTQYFYTTQSDKNTRNLLFTSLYYSFLSKPVLKGGFNYQFISFKDQVPTVYFSPSQFNAYEVFVELMKDEKIAETKSFFYNLNAATGFQYIEKLDKQSTYRIQAKLGYKFSDRLLVNIYGLKSNIASAAVSGFTYTEFGFRMKWNILSKPVFKLN